MAYTRLTWTTDPAFHIANGYDAFHLLRKDPGPVLVRVNPLSEPVPIVESMPTYLYHDASGNSGLDYYFQPTNRATGAT